MRLNKNNLLLYAVTDRSWLGDRSLLQQVEECIYGGATFIQLREKNISEDEYTKIAREIKKITDSYKIPFVINDNINVALSADADGVHVGQNDTSPAKARSLIGERKILGVSVQTVNQAIEAEKSGADYLGVGAVFSTSTKPDADIVDFQNLKAICQSVNIPVIAIGGINAENMSQLKNSGICGVAVVSAIFAQKNIKEATKKLKEIAGELF